MAQQRGETLPRCDHFAPKADEVRSRLFQLNLRSQLFLVGSRARFDTFARCVRGGLSNLHEISRRLYEPLGGQHLKERRLHIAHQFDAPQLLQFSVDVDGR